MDILAAMMKIKNIWDAMDESVIKNCWRDSKFFPDRLNLFHSVTDAALNRRLDEEALQSGVNQLLSRGRRVAI